MRTVATALVFSVLLVPSATATAANPPGARVIHTKEIIESFAIGGRRVAYDLRGSLKCNKVLVRDLRTGKTLRVSGKQTCTADSTSTGAGVRELAIAGGRIAWIVNLGGNTESDDYLYTASLPRPKERRLATSRRLGDVDGILAGTWIANLVASDNLLAVNRWVTDKRGTVTRAAVDLIVGNRLRRIVSSRNPILSQAADSVRIAVLYGDGSVETYASDGTRLRRFKPTSAKEIALRGDNLVVLTEGRTLEVYNARTGAYLRTWPVQGQTTAELDVSAGVAIYVAYPTNTLQSFKIHALHLRTGKDAVVATGNWQLRRSAELEPAGLLYARDRHNLVLVPFKRVLAAVS